jgi:hypothetical protein
MNLSELSIGSTIPVTIFTFGYSRPRRFSPSGQLITFTKIIFSSGMPISSRLLIAKQEGELLRKLDNLFTHNNRTASSEHRIAYQSRFVRHIFRPLFVVKNWCFFLCCFVTLDEDLRHWDSRHEFAHCLNSIIGPRVLGAHYL